MANNGATPESVGISTKRLERLTKAMQGYIDDGTIAGASTLIMRRGELVHSDQLGFQDREAGVPMSSNTIFRIYSMTKPIVSTALMLLHEEGAFELDDPVSTFIPAFADTQVLQEDGSLVAPHRPMTIRDLLTHTSGLSYDFMIDTPVAQMYRDARLMNDATRSLEATIDALAAIPLSSQPGARWHYSLGIDVAARLIEVMSDQPLGDFLDERLFTPLGMTDTGFGVPDSKLDRLAAMYGLPDLLGENYDAMQLMEAAIAGFNERIDVSETYPTDAPGVFQRGGVGLYSTGADYLRFATMLLNNGRVGDDYVIGRKTLELMHNNHLPDELMPYEVAGRNFLGHGFGLGSRVLLDAAETGAAGTAGEFGWAGAATTYYFVDPDEDLIGIFLTQYMTGPVPLDRHFRNLVYQAIVD